MAFTNLGRQTIALPNNSVWNPTTKSFDIKWDGLNIDASEITDRSSDRFTGIEIATSDRVIDNHSIRGGTVGDNRYIIAISTIHNSSLLTDASVAADRFITLRYGNTDFYIPGPQGSYFSGEAINYSFFDGTGEFTQFLERALAASASNPKQFDNISLQFGTFTSDLSLERVDDQEAILGTQTEIQLPAATGSNTPITYRLLGTLPSGLSFNPTTRRISGTVTSFFSPVGLTYIATDSDGNTRRAFFFLRYRTDISFGTATVPDQEFIIGVRKTVQLPAATGSNTPITYSLLDTLPAGLSFNPTARQISGTTSSISRASYRYRATDSERGSVTLTFSISSRTDITFGTATVPRLDFEVGVQNTVQLPVATGTSTPIRYSIDGDLPGGLSFNPTTRQISGTTTSDFLASGQSVTYTATDSLGGTDHLTLTFRGNRLPRQSSALPRARTWNPTTKFFNVSWDGLSIDVSEFSDSPTAYLRRLQVLLDADLLSISMSVYPSATGSFSETHTPFNSFASSADSLFSLRYGTARINVPGPDNDAVRVSFSLGNTDSRTYYYRIDGNAALVAMQTFLEGALAASTSTPKQFDNISLFVDPTNSDLSLGTVPNQEFTARISKTVQLPAATGTHTPFTYSIAGNLPTGLSFNPTTRQISGITTTVSSSSVDYSVTDGLGVTRTRSFRLSSISDITFGSENIPNLEFDIGVERTVQLPVATSTSTPITYSIAGLPTGLSFNPTTRRISGSVSTVSDRNYSYVATDSAGGTASISFRLFSTSDITFGTTTIPEQDFVVGLSGTSSPLPEATGTHTPFTYSIPDLVRGLSFNPTTRQITGTVTQVFSYLATYMVRDSAGGTSSIRFSYDSRC